jgi:hypothetical protein
VDCYRIDDYAEFRFNTQTVAGVATDADAAPTYRIYEENNDTVIATGECAKRDDANTTGYYIARHQCTTAAGFEVGKIYGVRIAATVDGVAGADEIGRFRILPAAVWNALFGGTGYLPADAVALSGDTAAADNAESYFDGTGYAGTNNTIPTVTAITNTVNAAVTSLGNNVITTASITDGAITEAKVADDVNVNVRTITNGAIVAASFAAGALDAVWSTAARTLTAFGTVAADAATAVWGAAIRTLTATSAPTDMAKESTLTAIKGAGWSGSTDTLEAIRDAIPAAAPTVSDIRTELEGVGTHLTTIKAKTDNLPADPAGVSDLPSEPPSAGDIADAVLDEAVGAHTGLIATNLDAKVSEVAGDVDLTPVTDVLTAIKGVGWDDETLVAIQAAIPGAAPSVGDIRTELEGVGTHLTTIKAKTDNLPADPAGVSDLPSEPPSAADIADAVLDEPVGAHTGFIATNLDGKISEIEATVDFAEIQGAGWDADTDTLEEISDAVAAISLAGDLIAFAYTVTRDGVPVEGALVRFCSDAGYLTEVKTGYTNALGVVTMNVPAETYYITVDAPGQARAYDSEVVA